MSEPYGDAAERYYQQGWGIPFPLPRGLKFPPPEDASGGKRESTPADLDNWLEDHANSNIGIRVPRKADYEVLGIDVDHYGSKRGDETLADLSARLGPLPETWRSTSRDPGNISGIRFFKVPSERKWAGKPGPDIEVIQHTHRYAAVAPSSWWDDKAPDPGEERTWRTYRWFYEGEECGIPAVSELPWLPEAWIEHIDKGTIRIVDTEGIDVADLKAALAWLAEHIPGWDAEPSSEMRRAIDAEALSEEMAGGAHDSMISRVHRVVQLAAEGHHGLNHGIETIKRAFMSEVLGAMNDEDTRRDMLSARLEFERAIVGEVSKLQADIANDYLMISHVGGYTAEDGEIDVSVFRDRILERWAERRNSIVDATEHEINDSGRAEIFLKSMGEATRPILHTPDEWAWWNEDAGRLVRLSKAQTYGLLWHESVPASLHAAAATIYARAELLEESGSTEAGDVYKEAAAYKKAAIAAGNKNIIEASMAMAHVLSRNPIEPSLFDTNPLTWGVGNGVLDLTEVRDGRVDDHAALLRRGTTEDLILQHTPVFYDPEATHPLWDNYLDTFLPSLTYRRYVRKVLGYAFMGKNPQRRIVFLQGGTSTGKTTLIEALQGACGDYADTISTNALFREKQDAAPMPEIIAALPRRMVMSSEIGQRNRLHADVIKRLTGGDSVSARALYSNDIVTRVPMFTPIIATNSMPTIEDGDAALWRRIMVLPFDHQVAPSNVEPEQIHHNPMALRAVLRWLVDGLLDYLLEGLDSGAPRDVENRKREFVAGTSDFQTFFTEAIEPAEGELLDCNKLYTYYEQWCTQQGSRAGMTSRDFASRMRGNGVARKKTTGKRPGSDKKISSYFYLGVRLIKPADDG